MRTFLQSSVGVTFYRGQNKTACFKKDFIECIFKLNRGQYVIIHVMVMEGKQVVLFANWGNYFYQLHSNKIVRKSVLRAMRNSCPKFSKLFTEEGSISCFSFAEDFTGLVLPIELDEEFDIFFIGNKKNWEAAEELKNFSLNIYNEINTNCPLVDWKNRLPK